MGMTSCRINSMDRFRGGRQFMCWSVVEARGCLDSGGQWGGYFRI